MCVNVNNGERPVFGETAKTTTRRVRPAALFWLCCHSVFAIISNNNKVILTPYFLEYMHFITSKMLYAHTDHKENS